ncbi:MAG: CBS domain-containing protein [Pirellulales bacterium]|nr:CBS domain-containing protein [Pirellulales bacterium]
MSTAKELMTTDLISIDPNDSIEEAISLMLKHRVSGLPVVDASGSLLGIISEFDLLELVWDPKTTRDRVEHYMSNELQTVDQDDDLGAIAEKFQVLSIRRLPVMHEGRLVGILSRHDLLRHIMQARGQFAPVVPRLLTPADSHAQSPAGR